MLATELAGDGLDFRPGVGLGRGEGVGAQAAVAEEALRQTDATELQRFQALGHQAAADDEFGRAAADVDHQPRRGGGGQHMRNPEVDESRLLVAADHVDAKTQRRLGLRMERRGIGRDAEGVGGDGAHRRRMQAGQAFAEAGEAGQCRGAGDRGQPAAAVHPGAEADGLPPGVEAEDLVAFDAADFQPEAVRPQVDDGERLRARSGIGAIVSSTRSIGEWLRPGSGRGRGRQLAGSLRRPARV